MSARANKGRRPPTLTDVARQAGVSTMTVSRVVNGAGTVRETTRKRVNAAIEQLGYAPNEAARRLAGGKPLHVAMLYARQGAYMAEFLFGGLEQARKHNAHFIVEKCTYDSGICDEIKRIIDDETDGLLIVPPFADSDDVLDLVESTNTPTVVVTSSRVRDSICRVGVDDYQAAHEMTEHLIHLGHKRIGFIVGHPRHRTSHNRLEGFRDAMREAGLDVPDSYIAQGYFTYRSGLDAATELLTLDDRPTAIFASNDEMASATATVAHRFGLDIPADLSVCGYDDIPIATAIWPQLTTIHVPVAELTRVAVDLLVRSVRAQQNGEVFQPRHVKVDYTLIRRQSDAAPRIRPRLNRAVPDR
jgi:LacI family transcriptional regulator